jgi:hypothetical protein
VNGHNGYNDQGSNHHHNSNDDVICIRLQFVCPSGRGERRTEHDDQNCTPKTFLDHDVLPDVNRLVMLDPCHWLAAVLKGKSS